MKTTNLVRPLALTLALMGSPFMDQAALAQAATTEDGGRLDSQSGERNENENDRDRDIKETTVTSTRSQRRTDNIPNVVTITTAEEIQEGGDRNIKDVFRDSPDVTVPQGPASFSAALRATGRSGASSINIRGLQDNRVLMMVDGIRVPNSFSFGPFGTGRGDFLEVDAFRRVEVLRGSSSTQFGSDGLAGAVAFTTFNPSDFLKDGKDFGGFVRSGFNSVDNSVNNTLAVAGQADRWSGMVLGNYRVGHEYQNKGSDYSWNINRSAPNPQDAQNWYLLAKAQNQVDANQKLGVTFETQNTLRDTNLYSSRGVSSGITTRDSWGKDTTFRNRISANYDFSNPNLDWVQKFNTQIYWQQAGVKQYTNELRSNGYRYRDNSYDQNTYGINTQAESNFATLIEQRWTYGLEWSSTDFSVNNNGGGTPAFTQYKVAPDTTQQLGGLFMQNELRYGDVNVIPGLRFDWYRLNPSSTGGYTLPTASQTDNAVSPRIGLVWNLADAFRPFAQWATAFKAPTPDQVNSNFSNPAQGYTSIANPNLKAEKGEGYEVGVRGQAGDVRYQASAYSNRYSNFISQVTLPGGNFTASNPTIYQYQNLTDVKIWGWDLRADWKFYPGWQANVAMAWSWGEQNYQGVTAPLNTIQPLRGIAGLRYDQPLYGGSVDLVYNQGKQASRVNYGAGGTANQFLSQASAVVNLTAYWKPFKNITINGYINNLFNTSYWNWSDVQGAAITNTANSIPAQSATAAPLNGGASIRYDF